MTALEKRNISFLEEVQTLSKRIWFIPSPP